MRIRLRSVAKPLYMYVRVPVGVTPGQTFETRVVVGEGRMTGSSIGVSTASQVARVRQRNPCDPAEHLTLEQLSGVRSQSARGRLRLGRGRGLFLADLGMHALHF